MTMMADTQVEARRGGPLGLARAMASRLAKKTTRRVFGNTVARQKNLAGYWGWMKARWAYDGAVDARVRSEFQRWRFLRIPDGAIDHGAVAALKARFEQIVFDQAHARCPFHFDEALYATYEYGKLDEKLPAVRLDVIEPLRSLPMVRDFFNSALIDVLRSCLGSHFVIDEFDAWRNYHVPESIRARFEATNDRWHFDHHRCDRLRLFVNLSDVTEDDGPTQFFDHPASADLIRYGYENVLRKSSETGGIPPEVLESHQGRHSCAGPSGTAVAVQTAYCLHRGGTRKPGRYRDLIAFTMQPAASTRILPAG